MFIVTKAIKCHGSKFQGLEYFVKMTDGNIALSFKSDGGNTLKETDLESAEMRNGKRYLYDRKGGEVYALPGWGNGKTEAAEQAAIMQLVTEALEISVIFVGVGTEHIYLA